MSARDAAPATVAADLPFASPEPVPGQVCRARLVGFADGGRTPLVVLSGTSAVRADVAIDLHGAHIGRDVVVLVATAGPARPLVIGVERGDVGWPMREQPAQVDVTADGERLVVEARAQLVLRCGKASLTLHADGRVEVRGDTIVSQASGANHVRGGSVQLN
jgi:hypothetical protein